MMHCLKMSARTPAAVYHRYSSLTHPAYLGRKLHVHVNMLRLLNGSSMQSARVSQRVFYSTSIDVTSPRLKQM